MGPNCYSSNDHPFCVMPCLNVLMEFGRDSMLNSYQDFSAFWSGYNFAAADFVDSSAVPRVKNCRFGELR